MLTFILGWWNGRALIYYPARKLTGEEKQLLTEGHFHDWRKVAAVLADKRGSARRAPGSVARALEEDTALLQKVEELIRRLDSRA